MKIDFAIRRNPEALSEARANAFWERMDELEKVPDLYEKLKDTPMTTAERAKAAKGIASFKARVLRKSHLYGTKMGLRRIISDIPPLIRECELATA